MTSGRQGAATAEMPLGAERLEQHLLGSLPEDGTPVLHRVMRAMIARQTEREIVSEDYFRAVDRLAKAGRIGRMRGQGGKIFLNQCSASSVPLREHRSFKSEARLMEPLRKYLEGPFQRWLDLPPGSTFIVADTSQRGPKVGRWARPDFVVVTAMRFQLLPVRQVEVHAFELKAEAGGGVEAVHEALAQTRFTHYGHLVWHLPHGSKHEARLVDIESQCETHGIGLILIRDPQDFNSWEIRLDPQLKHTELAILDGFLTARLEPDQRHALHKAVFGA